MEFHAKQKRVKSCKAGSKGLLQILWEHGRINPSKKLQNYVKESKQSWLDFKSDAKKFVRAC